MNIKKKITVKDVVGNKDKLLEMAKTGKGKPVPVCNIIGLVTKTSVKETDKGTSILFAGSFEGTNLETGEVFAGGNCYLPGVVENIVSAQFAPEDVTSMQFAWEISVQHVPDSIVGYEYTAKPLIEDEASDPLHALKSQINQPQLEDKSKTKAA